MNNNYLNVHRVVKLKYKHPFKSDWHKHEFYHYVYVLKGIGCIKIADKEYVVNKEEFYLIPSGKYHLIKTYSEIGFNTIEIKFTINNTELIEAIKMLPDYLKINKDIPILLNAILNEAVEKELFYKEAINNKFAEIIFYLIRFLRINKHKKEEKVLAIHSSKGKRMYNIEKFIEDNLREKISIEKLAEIANLSKTHFCSIFKEVYGLTLVNYINRLKHMEAKKYWNITRILIFLR